VSVRNVAAWLAVPSRWYLGALFVWASLHKIAFPAEFAVDIATYDLLPLPLLNSAAITLPWIEVGAGLMLLAGFRIRAGALLVSGMMLVFIAALTLALARGLDMSCGCFASQGMESDPISTLTLLRDLGWLALGVLVVCCDRGYLGIDRFLERRSLRA
jgi:putative oxidoreductase